jgi:hypothetical protein
VAAAVIATALSVVVVAVSLMAQQELRNATTALRRSQIETELDGMQLLAAVTVMRDGGAARYRWSVAGSSGPTELLAENEAVKLPLDRATALDDASLVALGVVVPERVRARLRAIAATHPAALDVAGLDTALLWRLCASSMISPYGRAAALNLDPAIMPADRKFGWLGGQVWHLRARSAQGWVDERIVRFTGDAAKPAAVVERKVYKGGGGGEPCSALIQ